ncbi:MAG: DUF1573 domain-containing protein [Muribaculaceae bacterium]|nr:DUF1573 domain-containing protein [Muribaculaceae bacterium]
MNQEINIPEEYVYLVNNDTVELDFGNADFKILTYIPAESCIPCNMNLMRWGKLLEELHSHPEMDIEFIMVINSPKTQELLDNIGKSNFLNPVTFDPHNRLKELNNLPEGNVNTFLLDEENRIIAMGDPSINPKILELYQKLMNIEASSKEGPAVSAQSVMPLGTVQANDTVVKRFSLANSGNSPLIIQDVIPSCDCMLTTTTSDTIQPNGHIFLTVKVPIDTTPGLMRKYVNVFFKEKDKPEQLTLYGYSITNNNNIK